MAVRPSYDIVVAGGAVMGSSAAWWLSHLGQGLRILVVERDPSYARSSTALSVASIRQQFSNPVNVQISKFGIRFIKNIHEYMEMSDDLQTLSLVENGYLFLAGRAQSANAMRKAAAMQRSLGAATELLDPEQIKRRFPWLEVSDVALGSFGPRDEGWFDNMGLLRAFRDAAQRSGVTVVTDEVVGLDLHNGRIGSVRLARAGSVAAGHVVNAAGTRAAALIRLVGQDMPVEPRKRTVFLIDAPGARHPGAPLLVDHTGFYLRPERDRWICASVPHDDHAADPEDFAPDHSAFEEVIWPRLYARAPEFDAVKVQGVWAGHYAFNTFDQNAIVGRVPGVDNFYAMNGFSGHGLQQAPAVGRGIAELILSGRYQSLDLSALGMDRIARGRPVIETAIV